MQERATRSRQAILDAALPIFARYGYAGASLNQIIEASGLTKGGFYFHFASKEALALAAIAEAQQLEIEALNAEISHLPSALDRLFEAPRALVRLGATGPGRLSKVIEELARDPDLRDVVCASIADWVDAVAEQFAAAQREGSIRSDLDPHDLAEVAVGGFSGMRLMTDLFHDDGLARRIELLIKVVQRATVV